MRGPFHQRRDNLILILPASKMNNQPARECVIYLGGNASEKISPLPRLNARALSKEVAAGGEGMGVRDSRRPLAARSPPHPVPLPLPIRNRKVFVRSRAGGEGVWRDCS